MDLISILFSFEGRINRAKYWLAALIYLIGGMTFLMIVLNALAGSSRTDPVSTATLFPVLFYAIGYPLLAVGCWSYAATMIKRLRDRNKSGWWIVPFGVLPILLPEVADRLGVPSAAFFLGLVTFGLTIWGFVETFCLRGTRGPNRFGPDPLGGAGSSIDTASSSLAGA